MITLALNFKGGGRPTAYKRHPVRIALDASLWDEPTTGIGLYTRSLYGALKSLGATVERWGARRSGEQPRRLLSRHRPPRQL